MRRGLGWGALVIGVFAWLLPACGSSSKRPSSDDCEPGTVRCDGKDVVICDEAGELTTLRTCTTACSQGSCAETACPPDTEFCEGSAVWACDGTGKNVRLKETCAIDESCLMDDTSARCSAVACVPGQPTCDDDLATRCKPDGSGPEPGGTDCTAASQLCYQGKCLDQACTPGERLCQNGDVHLCANSGTASVPLAECAVGEVCDPEVGACRRLVCEPAEAGCNGTRLLRCNEHGSGWEEVTDCADEGGVCSAGACQKQVCVPGGTFCHEGDVLQCNATGTGSIYRESCFAGSSRCQEFPENNFATCNYYECEPNEAYCDGNWRRICTPEGDAPIEAEYCGDDSYCVDGSCEPQVCKPDANWCQDGDIWNCDDRGSSSSVLQRCDEGTACEMDGEFGTCVVLTCEPGSVACIGNQVGTCNAAGRALASVTANCAADDQVCTGAGACAATAVDTIGAENELTVSEGNVLVGNVVKATSARRIVALEANLVLAAARDLRFVLYEESDIGYVPRIDDVVGNQKGSQYFSSGPLDYTLKVGKRYLLAVVVTGGNFGVISDLAPFGRASSLGAIEGGFSSFYQAGATVHPFDIQQAFQMRVTTALP